MIFFTLMVLLTACSVQTSNNYERNVYHNVLLLKKDSVPPSFFPKDLEILAIGDSLTEGIGDTTNSGGYTSFLENRLLERREVGSVKIINYGVQGHTTNDLLLRISKDIPKELVASADSVIITIGGNDILQVVQNHFMNLSYEPFNLERDKYKQRLQLIIDRIRNMNQEAQIYVVGLYNPFIHIGEIFGDIDLVISSWNQITKNLLSEYDNTTFIEIEDIFKNSNENLLYNDDFHPNTRGYELISARIEEYME